MWNTDQGVGTPMLTLFPGFLADGVEGREVLDQECYTGRVQGWQDSTLSDPEDGTEGDDCWWPTY